LQRLGKRLIVGILISGTVFLIFPSCLGFARVLPDNSFYTKIFSCLFAFDLPFNNMPSLNVVFSALITSALARSRCGLRWLAGIWLALICLSTLLVHQHHLVDIAAGLLLVLLLQGAWFGTYSWKERRNTAC
jgi:membrane-associated phospholipid phosphatase